MKKQTPKQIPAIPEEPMMDLTDIGSKYLEDDAKKELLRQLMDKKDIHMKTDVTSDEVARISALLAISELYDIKGLKAMLETFMQTKLSVARKSRDELIKGVQADNPMMSMQQPMSLYDKAKDRFGKW